MATQSEGVNAAFACDCLVTMLYMTSANCERLLECARTFLSNHKQIAPINAKTTYQYTVLEMLF